MQPTNHNEGPRPSLGKRLALIAGAVVGAVAVLAVMANVVAGLVAPDGESVAAGTPVSLSIEPGSAASVIYQALDDAGVVAYGDIEQAASDADAEGRLQPGTYDFVTGMDAAEVLRLLLESGTAPDSRTITIVEGWTLARILGELAESTEFTVADFEGALLNGAVTSPLRDMAPGSLDQLTQWEGLLYPATYAIPVGSSPAGMLQPMADEMVRRFEAADWADLEVLGVTRYEALVIGSLIEREAGTDDDRPLISSVIHNRLAIPMRLQIDATVIYALGSNPGVVSADDLQVESPYNTYRNDGLPPTPIGAVSEASLAAAIAPATTDYLFYVLASNDGSHAFAVTYEEHQENVRTAKEEGVLP